METPRAEMRRRLNFHLDDFGDSEDEFAVDESIPSTPLDVPAAKSTEHSGSGIENPGQGFKPGDGKAGEDPVSVDEGQGEQSARGAAGETEGEEQGEREESQCRICFGGVEEEDTLGRLISPCLCTGSMRYVHVKCINAWRGTGSNAKAFMECPQCHHQYRLRRTLASGLATSRPLLFLFSTMLFFLLTILTGSALHAFLAYSTSTRRKLLTANTMFETEATAPGFTTWTSDGGDTVIVMGIGGGLMWEVMVSSIQTFTRIALEFADLTQDWADSFVGGLFFDLGIRFILGLAVLGSFSFISLLFSVSFLGPFHIYNTIRGIGFLRNWTGGRDTQRQGRGSGFGQMMIVLFVLIGTVNTLWNVYRAVNGITQRILVYVEAQILEVNPEMRREEREKREQRKREGWFRRWVRNGRWKTGWGWWELVVRLTYALRGWAKHRWEVAREGWRRGLEIM